MKILQVVNKTEKQGTLMESPEVWMNYVLPESVTCLFFGSFQELGWGWRQFYKKVVVVVLLNVSHILC